MMKNPWILCNYLLAAIEKNDVERAAQIIDSGFDVDSVILNGKSAISICIERGVPEIAQLLLKHGCSLSLKSRKGEYPLHLAVLKGDVDMVKMLMKHRADVTSIDFMGQTPMHIACQMSAYDIVRALMDNMNFGEHLIPFDRVQRTPFLEACRHATLEVIEYLLPKSRINAADMYGESPLLESISNPNTSVEMVSLLLKAGANVRWINCNGETPLLKALRILCCSFGGCYIEKYMQIALLLIDHKSDLNVKNSIGQTPLHLAVCTSNEAIVRKLLNAGSSLHAEDAMSFIPLFYAIRNHHLKIIDILIQGDSNLACHDWEHIKKNFSMPYSLELIDNIVKICKQVKPLSGLCRTVIRKNCRHSVDEDADFLPIPPRLIKYIKLEE